MRRARHTPARQSFRASSTPLSRLQESGRATPQSSGDLGQAALGLLQLERDMFRLWCMWLFRPHQPKNEQRARQAFEGALCTMDDALARVGGGGPFFLGSEISLVDLMFVPFVERQAASLLYWKGFRLRNGGYRNIDRRALAWAVHACAFHMLRSACPAADRRSPARACRMSSAPPSAQCTDVGLNIP